jgi:hypothetical protein
MPHQSRSNNKGLPRSIFAVGRRHCVTENPLGEQRGPSQSCVTCIWSPSRLSLHHTVLLRPYVRRLSHPIFFEPGFERIQLIGGHRALMTRSKPRVSELTVVKVQYHPCIHIPTISSRSIVYHAVHCILSLRSGYLGCVLKHIIKIHPGGLKMKVGPHDKPEA